MIFPSFQARRFRRLGPGTSERAWLLAIVAVSVGLRIGAAVYLGNEVRAVSGAADELSYDALARRVAAGYGFSFAENWWPMTRAGEPTAHWSFLYTLLLAFSYLIVSPDPFWARLIQAVVVGVLQPWLVWRIGWPFGDCVRRSAAAITAVYGYFVFYSAALVTESLFIVATLASLYVATRLAFSRPPADRRSPPVRPSDARSGGSEDAPSAGPCCDSAPRLEFTPGGSGRERLLWFLLGLFVGLSVLLRQVALAFYPILLAWIVWQRRTGGTAWNAAGPRPGPAVPAARIPWLQVVGSAIVLVLLLAPWTVRNHLAFNRFVPLNTNAGFAMYWANHPIHGSTFIPVLPGGGAAYAELIPLEWRDLDEAALDRKLLSAGLQIAWGDPVRYAQLSLGRAREYFRFWPSPDSTRTANLVRALSFGVLLPLSLAGGLLIRVRPEAYGPTARSVAGLLLLFAGVHTAVHLASWGLVRYRLPVDAVLVVFAAVAVCALTGRSTPAKLDRAPAA